MKLYFAPETCSLSPHIVLRELELPFELIKVNNKTKITARGEDFWQINPKGYVAALQLDNGQILTEGSAIVQYLADLKPEALLAPQNGTWERVRLQEWLSFISSEIHCGMSPLFNRDIPEGVKDMFKSKLYKRFDFIELTLAEHDYLLGDSFSIADAYLFTVLGWVKFFAIDLSPWISIMKYRDRIQPRPSVVAALQAEALA
ncbi:glutathione transferase GstA [Aquirhabdus parva]|uniref:Glutathione transferase GstA n=1 Tax=Aquirhabdus parva TaxID=2283318 RepID=A0A345P4K1_9GAMM|nr:glutathione transferase GstA [Aquirhabdus parva]AXI02210.1 glutathione transferase GstA [Aquirhabdus parva]